ncbi:MAG: hypothetical protein ACRCS9_13965 [Hyphomicrobium sp.]
MFFEKPDFSFASASRGEPEGMGAIYGAALDSARHVDNLNARSVTLEEAYDSRISAVEAATGIRLVNPMRAFYVPEGNLDGPPVTDPDAEPAFDKRLAELGEQFPDKREAIRPDVSPREDARRRAAAAEGRLNDAMAKTPGSGKYLAQFAGGFRASFEDPFQVATLLAGPWRNVGTGAKAVIWSGIKQGAANAGVAGAMQPFVQSWRKEAGLDYGISQAAANVGTAFAFGFGVDAGGRALARTVRGGKGDVPILDKDGGVAGWKSADQALEDTAKALPEGELLRKAAEGDDTALAQLAKDTGADLDPAIQGALRALDLEGGLDARVLHADEYDSGQKMLQALRAAENDSEPAPRAADPVPPQKTPVLADDAATPGSNFDIEGKPVAFREVDPQRIATDAAVFQFKGGGDAAGATERLNGVARWDPLAAGKAVVYERLSGDLVIADGHQRLALAKRLALQNPKLQAFVFREADGWRPADVRALAAKKNLQEGSGTPIDAAKIMRDRPGIIDATVPLGSEAMRQARSMARLSDEAFGDVVAGMVPPNYAAIVGDLVEDRGRHASVLREMKLADPQNAREARFLVSDILQQSVIHETQLTLLGAEHVSRSLLPERAKVLDGAIKLLREDRKIFGLLTREAGRIEAAGNRLTDANAERAIEAGAVEAAIEQMAATRGKVSDWLTDAARDVATGTSARTAAERFAKTVRETLERDGLKGLAAEPQTLRSGGIDEPGGPEAKLQSDELALDLGPEIKAVLKPDSDEAKEAFPSSLFKDELEDSERFGGMKDLVEACKL